MYHHLKEIYSLMASKKTLKRDCPLLSLDYTVMLVICYKSYKYEIPGIQIQIIINYLFLVTNTSFLEL